MGWSGFQFSRPGLSACRMQKHLRIRPDLVACLRLSVRMAHASRLWLLALICTAALIRGVQSLTAPDGADAPVLFVGILVLVYVYFGLARQVYRFAGLGVESAGRNREIFRLLKAHLLVQLAFGLLCFFVFLFLIIFAGILVAVSGNDPSQTDVASADASLAALQDTGAIWLLWGVCIAAIAGLYWFAMRLVASGPASLDRGRLIIFQSWPWTRGQSWRLAFLVFTLQAVPLILGFWAITALEASSNTAGQDPRLASLVAAGMAVALLPAIYLGHALAVTVYKRCAPRDRGAQQTTPVSNS